MSFLESGIESLIFCSPKPIKIKEIIKVFEESEKKNYDENKIKNLDQQKKESNTIDLKEKKFKKKTFKRKKFFKKAK